MTRLEVVSYDRSDGPVKYPALVEVKGSCDDLMTAYLDDCGDMDYIDDILHGKQDAIILSTLQYAWSQKVRQGVSVPFDWQTVPAGIRVLGYFGFMNDVDSDEEDSITPSLVSYLSVLLYHANNVRPTFISVCGSTS